MVLLWGKPDWKETGGCDGLLAALREVSVARACSARSREGSSFTSAAKKGLQSFGEGVSAWLHSQSGEEDSNYTLKYTTVYYNISHCILQCTTVYYNISHSIPLYTTVHYSISQYISQYTTVYYSAPQYITVTVNSPGMVMTRKGIRMILAGRFGFCAPTASL